MNIRAELIDGLWIAFVAIWAISAARTKQTARKQSGASQLLHRGLAVAGAFLLFTSQARMGWLGLSLLPRSEPLADAGVLLTFAGIAFAVWARFVIGQNWSGNVTIKQGHELIRGGPYAFVRHPIYSGLLLALLGTALYLDELRGLIAIAVIAVSFILKSRVEETFMLEQFGEQYRQYQGAVKALIPFVL